ncbi:MAG TPA: hypothetical protein V6D25_17685 [Leptolyngbyaceae cyanobacterium]
MIKIGWGYFVIAVRFTGLIGKRNFQELVAVSGSIIATASILQSPAKDFCSKESMKDIFPKIPYFCDYPFSFSIAIALIIGLVVWGLRKRLRV